MRKNAWPMTISTCVLGALSMFLRWLQLQNVADETTGLIARGAALSTLVVLCIILEALMIGVFIFRMRGELITPEKPVTPRFHNLIQPGLAALACVLLLIAGISMLRNGGAERILGALFILCSLAMARFTLVKRSPGGKALPAFCTAVVAVTMCVWLIMEYKQNAAEPQLWYFVPGILATAATAMSFYYLAGYPFGRAKPMRTVFFTQFASYLCLLTAADPGASSRAMIFMALAALQLLESRAVMEVKG